MTLLAASVAAWLALGPPAAGAGAPDAGSAPDGGTASADAISATLVAPDSPPLLIEGGTPVYPPAALSQHVEGEVIVRLTVDATGAVTDAVLSRGVSPALDQAALEAARRLRFQPARSGGVPVAVTIDWRLAFHFPESPPASPQPSPVPSPSPAPASIVGGLPLRVRVLAKGTRRPLFGAQVTVDAGLSGETDRSGALEVLVEPGRHTLQVQDAGFDTVTRAVDVHGDGATELIRLPPQQTGERYETIVRPPDDEAPRVSVGGEELTHTAGSFGDPFRVIESLPGVSQVVWPLAVYAVRGANPGNTGFFIDGLRVPELFHFALGPSVIHPYFLDGLDFYPGGYPARFGRFVSGAVAARTAPVPVDMAHASADVRLFDAGGIVTTPFDGGRGSLAVAARVSYTGALFSLLAPQQSLFYADYQLRAEHELGGGRATVFAFGSWDSLKLQDQSADAELRFQRLDLRWERPLAGGRFAVAVAGGDDQTHSIIDNYPITVASRTLAPRLTFARPLGPSLTLEVGADGEVQSFKPTVSACLQSDPNVHCVPQELEGDVVQRRDAVSIGGFASLVARLGDRVVVTPAFRADTFMEEGVQRFEPEPRLQLRVRTLRNIWLKANVGRYAQMPSLPLSVPGFDGFDLKTQGTQTSLLSSLGVEAPLPRAFSLDATGFYQRYTGLTDLSSTFGHEAWRKDFFALRDGEGYGVELMIRRDPSQRLYGWLAYTLSYSNRVFDRLVVGPSDWDQRHILNLVSGYRMRHGWSASGRIHLNTGRPYPVQSNSGSVEYQRLPAFYQLDLRCDKTIILDRAVLDVYVELVNATLTPEVTGLTVGPNDQIQQNSFRIVLPSVGLHASF